jgi:hypothetical protein
MGFSHSWWANQDLAFPQTCRHLSWRSLTLTLKVMGSEFIEMLVTSHSVAETLDVIEDY